MQTLFTATDIRTADALKTAYIDEPFGSWDDLLDTVLTTPAWACQRQIAVDVLRSIADMPIFEPADELITTTFVRNGDLLVITAVTTFGVCTVMMRMSLTETSTWSLKRDVHEVTLRAEYENHTFMRAQLA